MDSLIGCRYRGKAVGAGGIGEDSWGLSLVWLWRGDGWRRGSASGVVWERGGASSVGPQGAGSEIYASWLFESGQEVTTEAEGRGEVVRRGIPAAEVKKKLEGGQKLSMGEMVRLRVRYFTDGLVIGGREFVEAYFEQNRGAFGKNRKSGARKVGGVREGSTRCAI